MTHEHTYRPSEEFRARLEREVLRRHQMPPAGPAMSSAGNRPRIRRATTIVICLILGAGAGYASAQIGRNAQRDSLLAAARAEATVADAQRDLAQAAINEVEEKLRLGLVRFDARYQAGADLADAERRRNRLAIDIEEITATGGSPRDDLNAPLVNGRDFVKLRIEADAVGEQARLRAAEALQNMVDAMVRNGVASTVTGSAAALDVATVRAELAMLAEKLALRAEFVKSGTSIEALTRRLHTARLIQDLGILRQRLAVARDRLAIAEQQRSVGIVSELDVMRSRLEIKETELSLQKTQELMRTAP